MKQAIVSIAMILAANVVTGTAVAAGDAVAGKQKAQVCAACHGTTGVAKYSQGQSPIIAGQYPDYIVRALKDYKSGKRENAIMQGMAAPLTEQDMKDLAAYFYQQEGLSAPRISNY